MDWIQDTATKVDKAFKILLPLLPNGAAKTPIYVAASEATYFAYKWKTEGLDRALRESGRRIGKEYAVPALVNRSWDEIAKRVPPSPLSGYAERAYKKTMTQILNKGVDALAEYRHAEES